jgi:single-strand DNA-binding protein
MDSDMPSVNKVVLIGHLTRDPQSKQLPSQTMVTEFGMAMNRKFKGAGGEEREEVCFVDCSVFGRAAEVIQKYCTKGKALYVEGRLKLDSWEDKQGGKRSKLSVVVENFQFIGTPDGASEREDVGKLPARHPRQKALDPFDDTNSFKEADIPF